MMKINVDPLVDVLDYPVYLLVQVDKLRKQGTMDCFECGSCTGQPKVLNLE